MSSVSGYGCGQPANAASSSASLSLDAFTGAEPFAKCFSRSLASASSRSVGDAAIERANAADALGRAEDCEGGGCACRATSSFSLFLLPWPARGTGKLQGVSRQGAPITDGGKAPPPTEFELRKAGETAFAGSELLSLTDEFELRKSVVPAIAWPCSAAAEFELRKSVVSSFAAGLTASRRLGGACSGSPETNSFPPPRAALMRPLPKARPLGSTTGPEIALSFARGC